MAKAPKKAQPSYNFTLRLLPEVMEKVEAFAATLDPSLHLSKAQVVVHLIEKGLAHASR